MQNIEQEDLDANAQLFQQQHTARMWRSGEEVGAGVRKGRDRGYARVTKRRGERKDKSGNEAAIQLVETEEGGT